MASDYPTITPVGEDRAQVWVDIRTTQRVVDLGLRAMLQRAEAPYEIVTEGTLGAQPDLVLYDVINLHESSGDDLDLLLKHSVSTVIAVNRTLKPELGTRAREKGVEWAITLNITDEELVQVIEEAISGTLEDSAVAEEWDTTEHLGQDVGLSRRESEVLQLVLQGLSNQEIAEAIVLSINSVKSYIRSAYRKIEVHSRSQAVIWGMNNGFASTQQEPEEDAVPE